MQSERDPISVAGVVVVRIAVVVDITEVRGRSTPRGHKYNQKATYARSKPCFVFFLPASK